MNDIDAIGELTQGGLTARAVEPAAGEGTAARTPQQHRQRAPDLAFEVQHAVQQVMEERAERLVLVPALTAAVAVRADQRRAAIQAGALVRMAVADVGAFAGGRLDRDKNPVVALREIAEVTVRPKILHESLVQSLQRVLPDEEDEADEIGSLSQSAEAMRLSAAAPARSNSVGGDYDG